MSYKPKAWRSFGLFSTLFLRWWVATAQQIHLVEVGAQGSFYVPASISALVNDTVRFYFAAATHTVIQSSWNEPCSPLPGGFSSGKVTRENDSMAALVWDLVVTSATEPIWFYCGTSDPVNHCTTGMVGVINSPSVQVFQQAILIAKNTANPVEYNVVSLTGHGAQASQPPGLPTSTAALSTSLTSSTTPTPSKTTAITAPSHPSHSHNHNAAIIAGAVGGILGFLILALIIFFLVHLFRRTRAYHIRRRNSEDFFRYRATPIELGKYTNAHASGSARNKDGSTSITFIPSKMIAPSPQRQRFPKPPGNRKGSTSLTKGAAGQQTTAVLLVQKPQDSSGPVASETEENTLAIGIVSNVQQNGTSSQNNSAWTSNATNNRPSPSSTPESGGNFAAADTASTPSPPPPMAPQSNRDPRPIAPEGDEPLPVPEPPLPPSLTPVHLPPSVAIIDGNPIQRTIRALPRLPSSTTPSSGSSPVVSSTPRTSARPPLPQPPPGTPSTPSMILALLNAKSDNQWTMNMDSPIPPMRSSASSQVLGWMETPPPSYASGSHSVLRQADSNGMYRV